MTTERCTIITLTEASEIYKARKKELDEIKKTCGVKLSAVIFDAVNQGLKSATFKHLTRGELDWLTEQRFIVTTARTPNSPFVVSGWAD